MSRKKFIIFPTENQIKYINDMILDSEIYILLHSKENDVITQNHNCIFLPDNDLSLKFIEESGMDIEVLCCHEEGLYWLQNFGRMNWHFQFSAKILEMLTKNKFKDYLSKHNIKNAGYCEKASSINEYPLIIKPIIGFGSIGVRKINHALELEQYLGETNVENIHLQLKPYKDRYFHKTDNFFIFEEYISGIFYRTPFIILENKIEYIFPIMGKHTTHKEYSDFHWTDFEYGKNERRTASKLHPTLKKLMEIFDLKDGVYVAEFIISDSGVVYLLEFSPRQTSYRIAKMIKLATGIDMEKLSIDIFLSTSNDIQLHSQKNIRMRIERNHSRLEENSYHIIDSMEEKSVYGDSIKTVYYEKRTNDEERI